jgi:glycine/D-amino acid oxidase-like deaminating enzyme
VTVDVAIIGAGIAGLTTAHELKKAGKRVAVIEARQVGHQVTGRSNAKITSLHSLIYADLTDRLGEEKARLYGEVNQEAINYIARTVTDLRIDCALERRPAYTVTCDPNRIGEIEAEVEAAQRLGLPAAMVRQLDLPYAIQAAVRFDHQGQFNPTAYLTALAGVVDGDGSFVFEGTRVLDVEDGEPARATCQGGEVTARDIVVATNLPIIPQGEFHKKAKPRAHLVMAAPIPADKDLGGMYLNIDAPTHSLRTTPAGGGRMLIAVGESYSPGKVQDTASMYLALAGFIRERFEIEPVAYRWANEDYDSQDRLPFVGLASRDVKHLRGDRVLLVGHHQRHRRRPYPVRHADRPQERPGRVVRCHARAWEGPQQRQSAQEIRGRRQTTTSRRPEGGRRRGLQEERPAGRSTPGCGRSPARGFRQMHPPGMRSGLEQR